MLWHETTARLLAGAGIPMVESLLVPAEAREAARASAGLMEKGAVVLKLVAPGFTHKTDAGLVALGLDSPEKVEREARGMLSRLPPGAAAEGFLIQPMIRGGVEVFLGAQVDPQFGPVVAFGPGGTLVELVGGVDFLRPPFTGEEALRFVRRNRLHPILRGVRGAKPSDLGAIVRAIEGLASLMTAAPGGVAPGGILSVDINPFVVFGEGKGGVALDARIEEAGA